jgi:hypothetical protein
MTSKHIEMQSSPSGNDIQQKSSSDEVPALSNFSPDIWIRHILPFVGKDQYRFVGAVNHHYRTSYLTLFAASTSFENVTTMGQAYLCCGDVWSNLPQKIDFCKVMVKFGRQDIVKYLFNRVRTRDEPLNDSKFTAAAAEGGHVDLLRWLVRKECNVDQATFAGAAVHGNLEVFQWLFTLPRPLSPHYSHGTRPGIAWNKKMYENAALHGHLPILKWAHSKESNFPSEELCSLAALNGHVHVLKWARSQNYRWNEVTCTNAALNGHVETLKWLRSNGCPWSASACASAALNGHMAALKWLRDNGCPWDEWTLVQAARLGHEDVVKWARSHGCPSNDLEELCDIAAEEGNLVMLKIAHTVLGVPFGDDTYWNAVERGHIHILKWLHAHGCPWHIQSCQCATLNGHFEVLKWLRSIGCPWFNEEAADHAAESGRMEILQWVVANGCPWSESTCAHAALGGHLNILQWLRANGCPWDGTLYYWGIQRGYLDVLKWAFSNGCPTTNICKYIYHDGDQRPAENICFVAACFKQLDVLQWARSHNVPWSDDICAVVTENRDLEMLDWVVSNGCPFPDPYSSLSHAFTFHQKDVLNWFVKNAVGLTSETSARAALEGNFVLFRWLYHKGCPWDETCCAIAAEKGYYRIISFARKHGCPGSEEYAIDSERDSDVESQFSYDDDESIMDSLSSDDDDGDDEAFSRTFHFLMHS